jgi:putative zinc finger/helix-turn-helix YgiT family protein
MLMSNAKTKPFPWKCRKCGQAAVRPAVVSYPAKMEHDGRVYEFTVRGLRAPRCENCREVFPDAQANRQISQTFRREAKLLRPEQILRYREALDLTQKELANALGIAEATVSRWETGAQIQQRSLDNLLRIFFGFPDLRRLLTESGLAEIGLVPEDQLVGNASERRSGE